MSFDMIKEANENVQRLTETAVLFTELTEVKELFDDKGNVIQEDMQKFIDDAREFIKHGSLPHYNMKKPEDKEDENRDDQITDPEDKRWYFAKMVAGLLYYMKKNLKSQDAAAFNMIAQKITKDSHIDSNIKDQAEQSLKSFVQKIGDNFASGAVKAKIGQYLDDIEDYYLDPVEA